MKVQEDSLVFSEIQILKTTLFSLTILTKIKRQSLSKKRDAVKFNP